MKKIWTYETTYKEAQKYNSKTDFKKGSGSAYTAAYKNKWLPDYVWFKRPTNYNKKWYYESCFEEAKKYISRAEFQKKCRGAYKVALKEGWLDDYYWLKDERFDKINDKIDSVYVYEFKEQNCAYVGRTVEWEQENRHYAHINEIDEDAVAKFAYENNLTVPKPIYLEHNITIAQGVELEEYWLNKYKEMGWTMLNQAKAGSIGALGWGKWTRNTCYQEAQKYTTLKEFKKGCSGAYEKAHKKGWIIDYVWLERRKPNGYYTYEICYQEAKNHSSIVQFKKNCSSAYNTSYKNGWLDEFFPKNKKESA